MSSTVTDVKAYQWYAGGQWRDVAGGKLFDDFEPHTDFSVIVWICATSVKWQSRF